MEKAFRNLIVSIADGREERETIAVTVVLDYGRPRRATLVKWLGHVTLPAENRDQHPDNTTNLTSERLRYSNRAKRSISGCWTTWVVHQAMCSYGQMKAIAVYAPKSQ